MKRSFITGFICGGIICAAVTSFAVEYAVTINPFPVKVNGAEKAIEGYNINDNTYFKLRDVADAVGGFEVGFADNTITIDTAGAAPEQTATPTPSGAKPTLNPNKEYSFETEYFTDDGLPVYNFDSKYYLDVMHILAIYNLDYHKFDDNYILDFNEIGISEKFVSLDYYQNVILPNMRDFTRD